MSGGPGSPGGSTNYLSPKQGQEYMKSNNSVGSYEEVKKKPMSPIMNDPKYNVVTMEPKKKHRKPVPFAV